MTRNFTRCAMGVPLYTQNHMPIPFDAGMRIVELEQQLADAKRRAEVVADEVLRAAAAITKADDALLNGGVCSVEWARSWLARALIRLGFDDDMAATKHLLTEDRRAIDGELADEEHEAAAAHAEWQRQPIEEDYR